MSKQNDDIFRLRELAIERDEARENLKENAADTKDKFKPVNLAKRAGKVAVKNAKSGSEKVSQSVKEKPVVAASVAATVVAAATIAAFHKPIGKLIDKGLNPQSDDQKQIED
ncbi:MAG: hypothetical protein ABJN65_03755 [Parasphingorhabdus sp.]